MNSLATTTPTTKNERWSTNVNDSCLAYKKSNNSDRLRKILDFGGENTRTRTRSQSLELQDEEEEEEEEEEERKRRGRQSSSCCPSRHPSIHSGISSLGDSMSSFGTTAGTIFKTTTKNSRSKNKNTLLQYSTMLSDSLTSFGSIPNNDRWRSSTASSKVSVRYPTHQKSNDNMLSLVPTTTSTTANHSLTNDAHQRRRWSAAHAIGNGNGNKTENGTTTSRGGGGDQPIGMVARKLSSTYLITIANNLI